MEVLFFEKLKCFGIVTDGVASCVHLIVWEAHTLLSHKAAEERHRDETEQDDEEHRPTDDALRLGTAKGMRGERERNVLEEHSLLVCS